MRLDEVQGRRDARGRVRRRDARGRVGRRDARVPVGRRDARGRVGRRDARGPVSICKYFVLLAHCTQNSHILVGSVFI